MLIVFKSEKKSPWLTKPETRKKIRSVTVTKRSKL